MESSKLLGQGLKAAKHGAPLPPGKNAVAAFVIGMFFGPVGVGLYLENWSDFWVPLAILFAASFLTGGVAAPLAWVFSGAWGAIRVMDASPKLS